MENAKKLLDIKFFNKKNISEKHLLQIKKLWIKIFNKKENDNIELLDETIVGVVLFNNNIIAISFLLCPSKNLLNSDIESYSNIKEQGVTENDCYIYNLCVNEDYRKKGYSKKLLEECHNYLISIGKQKIILFVDNGNIPAICLYNKFGYKVRMATPGGFVMEKNIH
jgi:ribosomal protein S18 acetylase RimI-like enzyme